MLCISDITAKNSRRPRLGRLSRMAGLPMWTVPETALVLRCHVATVRREIYRGTLVGVRIGNEWRIPASQFGTLARALPRLRVPEGDAVGPDDHTLSSQAGIPAPCAQRTTTASAASPTSSASSAGPATALLDAPQVWREDRPVLRLQLFGRPRVYIDDVRVPELDSGSRRSQVIALLALHRGGLSSGQLASSLEMENHRCEDDPLSTHYVRTLVWAIRQEARARTGWEGIVVSPIKRGSHFHRYGLPDNTSCDLWEFEDRLDRADRLELPAPSHPALSRREMPAGARRPPEQNRDPSAAEEAIALREEALQLYGGEFCEGSTNGYLAQAARVLEERYKSAALKQGDYWRARALALEDSEATCVSSIYDSTVSWSSGDSGEMPVLSFSSTCAEARAIWREALHNYERVLAVDGYHGEASLRAMECYACLGDARSVGMVFNRYRSALESDISQSPEAAMVRAYEAYKVFAGRGRGVSSGIVYRSLGGHEAMKLQMAEESGYA